MRKKTDIWMPLYIGDYLADTQHLSAEQSGGYLHLLMHSWKSGPLNSDTEMLRRIARIDSSAWSSAWSILQAFFQPTEAGTLVQPRLERERQAWNAKKAASVAKAILAANARHNSVAPSNASSKRQALLESCPSPLPSPKDKNTPTVEVCEAFQSAWNKLSGTLAKVGKITKSRTAKLRVRINEGLTVNTFESAVEMCASTPFLRGEGSRGFRASFDWLIDNDKNLTKVLEGQYNAGSESKPSRRYQEEDFQCEQ